MSKDRPSTTASHLWAVGYDDTQRADQVKDEITRLGWAKLIRATLASASGR